MSTCRVFSCVVGRGCLLWPVHSHCKTLLVFALLHSVFQGQICLLLQVFLSKRTTGRPWQLSWQRIRLQCRRPRFDSWVGKIPWRRERLSTPVFWPGEFPGLYSPWSRKELDTTERLSLTRDIGSIPGWERSHGEGNSYPLQYSGLENFLDCIVYGVAESWTWLNIEVK